MPKPTKPSFGNLMAKLLKQRGFQLDKAALWFRCRINGGIVYHYGATVSEAIAAALAAENGRET